MISERVETSGANMFDKKGYTNIKKTDTDCFKNSDDNTTLRNSTEEFFNSFEKSDNSLKCEKKKQCFFLGNNRTNQFHLQTSVNDRENEKETRNENENRNKNKIKDKNKKGNEKEKEKDFFNDSEDSTTITTTKEKDVQKSFLFSPNRSDFFESTSELQSDPDNYSNEKRNQTTRGNKNKKETNKKKKKKTGYTSIGEQEFHLNEHVEVKEELETIDRKGLSKQEGEVKEEEEKEEESERERKIIEREEAYYKRSDFIELQNKLYEKGLNTSFTLTKNDISYYCGNNSNINPTNNKNNINNTKNNNNNNSSDNNSSRNSSSIYSNYNNNKSSKMNKSCPSESANKGNLKLNINNSIYNNEETFYKNKMHSNEKMKMHKRSSFSCNLRKNNLLREYENDNLFSQGTKKSFEMNDKCMNNSTKIKIKRLCEKIEGFEKEIKNEILQKKNVEKEKIYIIREAINKLEKNLNMEIKKRIEHNRNIQNIFSSEILKVQEKIENVVNDKVSEIENVIKILNEKINTITVNIENEKIKCIQNLEKKNNNIAKEFSNLQNLFQQDKANNKEKESSILKRLEEIEKKSESKIEIERNIRDTKYQEIVSYIDEIKREKKNKIENFQNFALEEIATVKNGLILETQAREAADDDIVQAVNHYTKALQDSLRLINSN